MRADRLVATLLVMQARGRVTAAELAEELEVSVATARRDLLALSSAGVPVYPQPGRGGGWSLLGGGRTDLSGFTAGEARALLLLLGPRADASEVGRSALRKVLRALPEPFRRDAQAASAAVVVGGRDWREASVPEHLDALQHAVIDRRAVRFDYTAWGREPGARLARPLGLGDRGGTWYLLADTDAGRRTYRLDRMARLEILDDRFDPPAGFDLDEAWAELGEVARAAGSRATAVVLVEADLLAEFRGWVGPADRLPSLPGDGDRVRVRVGGHSMEVLARRLAGWAEVAAVVEPAELRVRLGELGAALARRYPTDAPQS
ncbi:WYL domain-containing protein [Agromyces intestinalis]|uniref:WYL domain-containing protein n=1 Tax=Agromyces intestinalis TaxID=2592652 RepID=A0A5C1YG70_9MICO|nr:WYL domain-containing protein [Agromyces intestinalis]QEO14007.1 WYL domain-containing protein [Agromyces intestinalis]